MGVEVRIAVDALGGDHGCRPVVGGALLALDADESLGLTLVGRVDDVVSNLQALDSPHVLGDRLNVAHADEGVSMAADPVAAVRSRANTSVRVCADLVRLGSADAMVSAGQTAAALAAATFVLGRLPGITRPALAVVIPSLTGPVVLLDAGAGTGTSVDVIGQHALAGASYAEALGIVSPKVGLLSVGGEPGKGDDVRRVAHEVLMRLPINYVGPVEGHDLALGGVADVVVTDGFTGNVALKALEGAVAWSATRLGDRYGDPAPAQALVAETAHSEFAGGMLVGVCGVSVIAHGGSGRRSVAAAIALAALAVRANLVPKIARSLEHVVAT